MSNDATNATFTLCHDMSKAYYPHIIAQALCNLLEISQIKQQKNNLKVNSIKNSGHLKSSSMNMNEGKIMELDSLDHI